MINTTIKVVSSDGVRSSEEVIIIQSAGLVSIDDDRNNHVNSIPLDNVQYAVKVTLDNVLDAFEDEQNRRNAIHKLRKGEISADDVPVTSDAGGGVNDEGDNL